MVDMADGSVWRNPDRPAAVVVGINGIERPDMNEDDVHCWNCAYRDIDYIVEVVDDQLGPCRVGICADCYHNCADAEGWLFVEEL